MRMTTMMYAFKAVLGVLGPSRSPYRLLSGAAVLVAGLGCGVEAQAAALDTRAASCVANNGGLKGPTSKVTYEAFNRNMWTRTLTTPQSAYKVPLNPVRGEVLFSTTDQYLPSLSGTAQQGQAAALYNCPLGSIEQFVVPMTRATGFTDVFKTLVPGIGFRVYYYITDDQGSVAAPAKFVNEYSPGVLVYPFNGNNGLGRNVRTRIEFIATGEPIVAGTIQAATVFGVSQAPIGVAGGYKVALGRDITISEPTCEVTNRSALEVKMPDIHASAFASSPLGGEQAIDIFLQCSSPSQSGPTIKVTPIQRFGSSKNILGNMATGLAAAKGVGVQLQLINRYSDTRVDVDFDSKSQNVAFAADFLPTSSWLYSLGLRYVLTGAASDVRAGEVKAQAFLTFTYS